MGSIRDVLRRVPFAKRLYRAFRGTSSAEAIFSDYYRNNSWGGKFSLSGTGSDLLQTAEVARALPELIQQFDVTSILDLPCGDFRWMQHVDLGGVTYIGGDIVKDMVEENQRRHGSPSIGFQRLNVIQDDLPKVDLVFFRDCLVHLSFEDGVKALNNIRRSGARLLLTTTFNRAAPNQDIETGQWRPINLTNAPYNMPEPVLLLNERCTEDGGKYADKSLGLWYL